MIPSAGVRGRRVAAALALVLTSCEPGEVREWKCVGPLVELVKWRDGRETARTLGGEAMTPAGLLKEEREHVAATVVTLKERRLACEMTWSVLMHQPPENPSLRLREEALLQALGLPPRDYPPQAVGFAGETVAGRRPVSAAPTR